MTKSELWILSEWKVAQDRVLRFSEKLIHHRHRTPFAEVDLIFRTDQVDPSTRSAFGLRVVEVKTWQGELWGPHLLSRGQRQRLERACLFLSSKYGCQVFPLLAVFNPKSLDPDQGGEMIRYFELEPSY